LLNRQPSHGNPERERFGGTFVQHEIIKFENNERFNNQSNVAAPSEWFIGVVGGV
jgi:hypothetical protein